MKYAASGASPISDATEARPALILVMVSTISVLSSRENEQPIDRRLNEPNA
jgi:hypothetical protein